MMAKVVACSRSFKLAGFPKARERYPDPSNGMNICST